MSNVREARVTRLSMAAPDDVAPIEAAIAAGTIDPAAIGAIFGKTEGNGCVNDFTRAFAVRALRDMLRTHLGATAAEDVALVMSGGTEGALSPHWLVFEAVPSAAAPRADALALGVHLTPALAPEQIGRTAQAKAVAAGVVEAMRRAGIASPDDVHYVQVKCPLITVERATEAAARGAPPRTTDTLKSMGLSRGAASLGVALALGEVAAEAVTDAAIGADFTVFSRRASASSGVELMANEIVVLGRSAQWTGPLTIDSTVMADAVDLSGVLALFQRQGLAVGGRGGAAAAELVALLSKAEASSTGRVRGFRHTMLDDSDIAATRHARGFVAGVLAGVVGHAEIFVSGGAEHQGPDGGGPVAAIVRRG
ncbi:ring-opening amidohydrolase [Acuticoccus sp. I52.16.1]|uniref:cyanuric acid amidohydrolase n=1 Tax=Acuticoccus sp. I52.16.1 TaxID=2928472 RepID=UPI001FD2B8B7|nr:ring-opening amidohydrolase [Acuticoccus sp. I52.16.1]UOM33938.1 ring-opening amidohydrolase [Acuticoccus sp. I52.16.1]